jgi:hypothetical protein
MKNILSLFTDANCDGKIPLLIFEKNDNEIKKITGIVDMFKMI